MQKYTDLEISKIEQFCKDKDMFDAVRKVILEGLYRHGTPDDGLQDEGKIINGAFSLVAHSMTYPITDEVLGQNLKAQWAGLNALKSAYDRLLTIKMQSIPSPIDVNEAI